jgi:hypothetical protein
MADRLKEMNEGFTAEAVEELTGWERQSRLAAMQIARNRLESEQESDTETGSRLLDYQARVRKAAML